MGQRALRGGADPALTGNASLACRQQSLPDLVGWRERAQSERSGSEKDALPGDLGQNVALLLGDSVHAHRLELIKRRESAQQRKAAGGREGGGATPIGAIDLTDGSELGHDECDTPLRVGVYRWEVRTQERRQLRVGLSRHKRGGAVRRSIT